jgi:protein PhnA
MAIGTALNDRAQSICELCGSNEELFEYLVPPKVADSTENCVALCTACHNQVKASEFDKAHMRCLESSIWSEVPPVQALSYRILNSLGEEEILSNVFLDDEILEWAQASEDIIKHFDSNGNQLYNGDNVVIIQDLDVKGANFTAKKGTTVRNIKLVSDNSEQIGGKVNEQSIILLTKFLRKA